MNSELDVVVVHTTTFLLQSGDETIETIEDVDLSQFQRTDTSTGTDLVVWTFTGPLHVWEHWNPFLHHTRRVTTIRSGHVQHTESPNEKWFGVKKPPPPLFFRIEIDQ